MSEMIAVAEAEDESPVYWGRHRESDSRFLTLSDRCEVIDCGAQAYVRFYMPNNAVEFLFCGHHGERRLASYAAGGFDVQDERYLLAPPIQQLTGETQTDKNGWIRNLEEDDV